jgi:putative flippase GtrA
MSFTRRPRHRARLAKFVRYASVSAISTVTSLTVLGVLVGLLRVDAVVANVVATAIGTVPSFELNRRWVWSQRGGDRRLTQLVPFCALSFGGLVLSSIAVHLASAATLASSRIVHTGAVELANVGAYGALWLIQFFLCDRLLFAHPAPARPAPATVLAPPEPDPSPELLESGIA